MTTLFHCGGTVIPNIYSQCIYKLWVVIINRASILAKFSFYCQNLSYNSSCAAYIQPYVEENHALIQSIQELVPTSTALHPIAPNQEAHQRWPSSHRVCCSHGRSWRRRILSEREILGALGSPQPSPHGQILVDAGEEFGCCYESFLTLPCDACDFRKAMGVIVHGDGNIGKKLMHCFLWRLHWSEPESVLGWTLFNVGCSYCVISIVLFSFHPL